MVAKYGVGPAEPLPREGEVGQHMDVLVILASRLSPTPVPDLTSSGDFPPAKARVRTVCQ